MSASAREAASRLIGCAVRRRRHFEQPTSTALAIATSLVAFTSAPFDRRSSTMAGSPESAASVRGEYCNRMRIRVGIRAVIEKKLDDRHITGFSGGNDQGRVH